MDVGLWLKGLVGGSALRWTALALFRRHWMAGLRI